ncbi:MAG: hypothetical protein ACTJHT_04930 [Sphingobacterium sp.]|uniref:hypothetical protein n=1 Tax=Sphingobacterium sp. JB170 TaxID=1434842 RepID=UPI00097F36FC|nr:hypothetical protein [Sphingobacterium sp. JB170]SJN39122.1 hypothetical protein FM107_09975 [Sphingobacterium sp. JB170]
MEIKDVLYKVCLQRNNARLDEINHAIGQSQEAIENDTKSSAGDKYETTREMIQQDLNRFHDQLAQAKVDEHLLHQIDLGAKLTVALGAVVLTDRAFYFIAISLGRIEYNGDVYMVVSPSSPIGALMLGKSTGDSITFNGISQTIVQVF